MLFFFVFFDPLDPFSSLFLSLVFSSRFSFYFLSLITRNSAIAFVDNLFFKRNQNEKKREGRKQGANKTKKFLNFFYSLSLFKP